jgi:hypothetical protein
VLTPILEVCRGGFVLVECEAVRKDISVRGFAGTVADLILRGISALCII